MHVMLSDLSSVAFAKEEAKHLGIVANVSIVSQILRLRLRMTLRVTLGTLHFLVSWCLRGNKDYNLAVKNGF